MLIALLALSSGCEEAPYPDEASGQVAVDMSISSDPEDRGTRGRADERDGRLPVESDLDSNTPSPDSAADGARPSGSDGAVVDAEGDGGTEQDSGLSDAAPEVGALAANVAQRTS